MSHDLLWSSIYVTRKKKRSRWNITRTSVLENKKSNTKRWLQSNDENDQKGCDVLLIWGPIHNDNIQWGHIDTIFLLKMNLCRQRHRHDSTVHTKIFVLKGTSALNVFIMSDDILFLFYFFGNNFLLIPHSYHDFVFYETSLEIWEMMIVSKKKTRRAWMYIENDNAIKEYNDKECSKS